nr:hypothetical protein [uncultured Ruminococcus sp.]
MKESIFRNRAFQTIIKLITALSFALFTAYQIYLAVYIDTNRAGRLIGIVFYLLLTVASFLDFSEKDSVWVAHSVLMVGGLILLFTMRLLSIGTVFANVSFANPPSVLNAVVYILSQLGTLVLVAGYLMIRADLTEKQMQRVIITLMTIAIVLFTLHFILECVLMIKYRMNIEQSLKLTLVSRVLYFVGFAGTAFCFMLPAPKRKRKEPKAGRFIYSDKEDGEDDIDLVI